MATSPPPCTRGSWTTSRPSTRHCSFHGSESRSALPLGFGKLRIVQTEARLYCTLSRKYHDWTGAAGSHDTCILLFGLCQSSLDIHCYMGPLGSPRSWSPESWRRGHICPQLSRLLFPSAPTLTAAPEGLGEDPHFGGSRAGKSGCGQQASCAKTAIMHAGSSMLSGCARVKKASVVE